MTWKHRSPPLVALVSNYWTLKVLRRIKGLGLMRRVCTALLAAVLALGLAGAAALAEGAPAPGVVAALTANGAQLLPLGERSGLTGYVVTLASGEVYTLYVTADGHGVAGLLYAPDGAMVTGAQVAAATAGRSGQGERSAAAGGARAPTLWAGGAETTAALPSQPSGVGGDVAAASDVGALFGRSGEGFGFTLARPGSNAPAVVLFGDPACPWSRSAVARLGEQALAGRLRLRVLPVALLGEASARWAAGVASAGDPALAWFAKTPVPASADGARRIERNNALFSAWGERSVPLIVWRGRNGAISRRTGDIADIAAWLEELGR